jgi:hypothetical protein
MAQAVRENDWFSQVACAIAARTKLENHPHHHYKPPIQKFLQQRQGQI